MDKQRVGVLVLRAGMPAMRCMRHVSLSRARAFAPIGSDWPAGTSVGRQRDAVDANNIWRLNQCRHQSQPCPVHTGPSRHARTHARRTCFALETKKHIGVSAMPSAGDRVGGEDSNPHPGTSLGAYTLDQLKRHAKEADFPAQVLRRALPSLHTPEDFQMSLHLPSCCPLRRSTRARASP